MAQIPNDTASEEKGKSHRNDAFTVLFPALGVGLATGS